jgi:hypothetical protein
MDRFSELVEPTHQSRRAEIGVHRTRVDQYAGV